MGYSAEIKIDPRPKKNGHSRIYMQVIINRVKREIDLDIDWPEKKFVADGKTYCKPRYKNDPDFEEYNVIIGNALSKANAIRKSYLLRGIFLTVESFHQDYASDLDKNDFITYISQKSYYRYSKGKISKPTYEKEKGTIKRLKQFAWHNLPGNQKKPLPEKDISVSLPFHKLNSEFAPEFDAFLEKFFKNEINGRWNRHKHLISYLNTARDDDKIPFDDPYSKFTNKLIDGKWQPLDLDQLKVLIDRYITWKYDPVPPLRRKNGLNQVDTREGLTRSEIIVLRRFLFGCGTGLRISDLLKMEEDYFKNNSMTLVPDKTERHGNVIDSAPLNQLAQMMLEDEIEEVNKLREADPFVRIFSRYTAQAANRLLKRIALKCKLEVNLHNHVERYTFASIMDEAGANHTALMKFLGIKKRETLAKYTKTNKKVMAADVVKFDGLISLKR